jgi:EAL domain-containing protein (putative c-di-GMP-specific phosphodiesterase class I)
MSVAPAADADPAGATVLETALQPIVSLGDERVFAFETLTRVRGGRITTAQLFDRATRRHAAELNIEAIHCAFGAAHRLPPQALLFVNADPVVLGRGELPGLMCASSAGAGFPLSRLVVEITERSGFPNVTAAARVLDALRGRGVRFALDDFGSAHSHLTLLDVIRPSFIKIGHEFGTGFEHDPTHALVVRHVAALARDFGCATILEGIESPATARAARELGIEYAQGYHFGRPLV